MNDKAKGYEPAFLGKNLKISMPQPAASHQSDLVLLNSNRSAVLRYQHHSIVLSRKRKFPFFTAVNIDSTRFREINRNSLFPGGKDVWTIDKRVQDFQWGPELYNASGSDFDKGHLVKREDPQWGKDEKSAADAARSTFYYTNCVPQLDDLNRKEWQYLENYILKKESAPNKLRVSVFAGPVLADDDPVFVNPIKGMEVQIPVLFWKVVYFSGDGKNLYRVAFLMSQQKLLLQRRIVKKKEEELEAVVPKPELFHDFEDAAIYQVNIRVIEQLTKLTFSDAHEPYRDNRAIKIILKQVEVGEFESFRGGNELGFELGGLILQ